MPHPKPLRAAAVLLLLLLALIATPVAAHHRPGHGGPAPTPSPTPSPTPAPSEPSGCSAVTHTVPSATTTVDGDVAPWNTVAPGDTLQLTSGTRGRLRLDDLHGTEACPITVTDDGLADVNIAGSAGQYAGIEVNRSTHLRIVGTSHAVGATVPEASHDPSLSITGTDRGVGIHNGAEFVEVGWVAVHDTAGNPGVHVASQLKTAYGPDGQRRIYLHDMDVLRAFDSEGFYIGESAWVAGGAEVELNSVRVENNLVVDSEYDGIQVGSVRLDTAGPNTITGNIVRHAGHAVAAGTTHDKGIIVNRGTWNADVTKNVVVDSAGAGIYDQGVGGNPTVIANNLVVNAGVKYTPPASGGSSIRVSTGNPAAGSQVHVLNNTTVTSRGWGVDYDRAGSGNLVADNILLGNPSGSVDPETGMTASTNFTSGDPLFVDPAAGDYQLQAGSPAVDAGMDVAPFVVDDLLGVSRPQGSGWDIGAYERVP